MRLSLNEVQAFVDVLSQEIKMGQGKLYLYGSRTHDTLKGGDIDLLLLLDQDFLATQLSLKKYMLLNEFKKRIGNCKIDFSILSIREAEENPFYKEVLIQSVLLKKW